MFYKDTGSLEVTFRSSRKSALAATILSFIYSLNSFSHFWNQNNNNNNNKKSEVSIFELQLSQVERNTYAIRGGEFSVSGIVFDLTSNFLPRRCQTQLADFLQHVPETCEFVFISISLQDRLFRSNEAWINELEWFNCEKNQRLFNHFKYIYFVKRENEWSQCKIGDQCNDFWYKMFKQKFIRRN